MWPEEIEVFEKCPNCGYTGTGSFYSLPYKLKWDYVCIHCRAGAFRKDGRRSTKGDHLVAKAAYEAFLNGESVPAPPDVPSTHRSRDKASGLGPDKKL